MRSPRVAPLIPIVLLASVLSTLLARAPIDSTGAARAADTPAMAWSHSRWRLEPFGRGLPDKGQWRQGFAIADMNGDGHPDLILPPPRGVPGVPEIFLGDGIDRSTRK